MIPALATGPQPIPAEQSATARFLRHILPTSGLYIAAEVQGRWQHEVFKTIEGLAEFLVNRDAAGQTVYHACASFQQEFIERPDPTKAGGVKRVQRVQENVKYVRSFWLDLDVDPTNDRNFFSQADAITKLKTFCDATGLPIPLLVSSGYGIHCYWPLTRDISLGEWKSIAEALKAKAHACGFLTDDARTSDSASVLRPVGTHNRKHGGKRQVELLAPPGTTGYAAEITPETFAFLVGAFPAATLTVSATANAEFLLPYTKRAAGPLSNTDLSNVRSALLSLPADDYEVWIKIGAALHSTGDPDAFELWDTWSRRSPKYHEGETAKKWASFRLDGGIGLGTLFQIAKSHGFTAIPSPERLTDVGNAMRLVRLYGQGLRYVERFGKWLVWSGARWTFDEERCVERLAKMTAKSLYDAAASATDEDRRKALARHAANAESAPRIEAMIRMARSEPGIPLQPGSLDRDQWLLNLKNGTLDLRTLQLRAASPGDCITKQAGVAFDPAAACPTWERFIHEVMCGNAEVVEYLQRALGYSLTGSTAEQVMFILHGFGANGKSTLLNAIRDVMGDYAMTCAAETLMLKREGGISNDIARLRGARVVAASETEDGHRLAESLVKQLTGGDVVTARFLHQEFFEFTPEFKIFLAANHRPIIQNSDYSIWRRIHLIPFERTFADGERDPELPARLRAELPGILNWMLRGLESYQRVGLKLPAAARAATDHYRSEMDVIGQWIEENCDRNPEASTAAKDLFMDYRLWAGLNGRVAMSNTRFGQRLSEAGFPKIKSSVYRYRGLALKALREIAA